MMDDHSSRPPQGSREVWKRLWARYPVQFASLGSLQGRIGYSFKDPLLLYEALTHRSAIKAPAGRNNFVNSYRRLPDLESLPWNERIEFLGDSILNLVISTSLWPATGHDGKLFTEGELSRLRSSLVNETTLAQLAIDLRLGESILLSRGETRQGARTRPGLLADVLEALFGAVYLDGGFEAASSVIGRCFKDQLVNSLQALERDSKSWLQEWSQKRFQQAPEYEVVSESGPAHSRKYEVSVSIIGVRLACAKGCSKKRASQIAAGVAIEKIESGPSVEEGLLHQKEKEKNQ